MDTLLVVWIALQALLGLFLLYLLTRIFAQITPRLPEKAENALFDIVVPFRDEATHIPKLLNSLDKMELLSNSVSRIVFVNDHSSDGGEYLIPDRIRGVPIDVLPLPASQTGKKQALAAGMRRCTQSFVATLDADVILLPKWATTVGKLLSCSANRHMIVMPVSMQGNGVIGRFFSLEFRLLQQITFAFPGFPLMANGANLVIRRTTWLELSDKLLSKTYPGGDDMFMLHLVRRSLGRHAVRSYPHPHATAITGAPENLKSAVWQRLRWIKKPSIFIESIPLLAVLLAFLAGSAAWCIHSLLILNKGGTEGSYLLIFPILITFWIGLSTIRMGERNNLIAIPLFLLAYPVYVIFMLIISPWVRPRWKGRPI